MPYTVADKQWQAIFAADTFSIGIRCDESAVIETAYLPSAAALSPQNLLAKECIRQLNAYFKHPHRYRFNLPLMPATTAHQQRVRQIVVSIAPGQTMTYGDVAKQLKNSSPRAVGGACRANPIPLIIPCHRIVATNGIGGFMGDDGNDTLSIKRHLLKLETTR